MVCWWVVWERVSGRSALFRKVGSARLFWVMRFVSGQKVNGMGFACFTLEQRIQIRY